MIYGLLNPPLFDYLKEMGTIAVPFTVGKSIGNEDIFIISVYQSASSKNLFAGISKVCDLRLKKLLNPIILLSFFSKEKLSGRDEYGVLSLTGYSFLQLPIPPTEMANAIKTTHAISNNDLDTFCRATYKKMLQAKLRCLNHGNKLTLTDYVLAPLSGICALAKKDKSLLPKVQEQLKKVKDYTNNTYVTGFIRLAEKAPLGDNEFFLNISQFISTLAQLSEEADKALVDLPHLTILTEKLEQTYTRISNF